MFPELQTEFCVCAEQHVRHTGRSTCALLSLVLVNFWPSLYLGIRKG